MEENDFKNINRIKVFTDGGALKNPGPAAIGVVVYDTNPPRKYKEFINKATNNQAEYLAMIFALKKIKQIYGKDKCKLIEVEINSDSKIVVFHMKNIYKVREDDIKNFFIELHNLTLDFKNVEFNYIPREKNKLADSLVKDVLKNFKKF